VEVVDVDASSSNWNWLEGGGTATAGS